MRLLYHLPNYYYFVKASGDDVVYHNTVLSAGCTCCYLSHSKPAPTCKILHPLHEDDWEKTCTENVRKTYV